MGNFSWNCNCALLFFSVLDTRRTGSDTGDTVDTFLKLRLSWRIALEDLELV
ncbi:hypothetical protein M6B38_329805 [Iris pallida]|uniref:Uncharacterized protein n=1 Tax=Iris pallida TaxID=29817 RepID=A0AAX6H4T7_IRIPA|nr:hypothetical protein M6B38_329805 [Iris pallida]